MSEIRAATISDAAGTGPIVMTGQKASKALLTYDQVAVSIDESFNITSVTDVSAGKITYVITNVMATATYSAIKTAGDKSGAAASQMCGEGGTTPKATTGWGALILTSGGTVIDRDCEQVSAIGDLA